MNDARATLWRWLFEAFAASSWSRIMRRMAIWAGPTLGSCSVLRLRTFRELGRVCAVSRFDDIVICQYIGADMKRQTDPDVLLLQAAADPTRLAILRQLSAEETVCACDFTACCDVSQPTVSHHLKVLREAGWVDSERRGTWVWYRIRPEATQRMHELVGGFTPGPARQVQGTGRKLSVVQPTA
jgi:DNA-binding transcriptional ArsR family regulator